MAIEMGVPIDAVTGGATRASMLPPFRASTARCKFSVDAGADLHVLNKQGHTPYGVAEGGRCCSQVPMLIYKKEKTAALLHQLGGAVQ